MMKSTFIRLLLVFLTFQVSCVVHKSTNTIREIPHRYSNVTFLPLQINKTNTKGVDITVLPIDAASLDKETFSSAMRDGNYEKEIAIQIDKQKAELSKMSKAERNYRQGLINAVEEIDRKTNSNEIPAEVALKLKYMILGVKEYDKDGSEIETLSSMLRYDDSYNPFKINQKYLSVFKVTFENQGKEIIRIPIDAFQITSGEELLYPLKMDYFENNLKDDQEKIKNAYRMNMPMELVLTPGQKITKYISIPAFNTSNSALKIQHIENNEILNFDFQVKPQNVEKIYMLNKFLIAPKGLSDPLAYNIYYGIAYKDDTSFATSGDEVFASAEQQNLQVSVYGIAVRRNDGKVKTATTNNIKLGILPKKKIELDFAKK